MPPVPRISKRVAGSVHAAASEPSTWKVLSAIGGAAWFTYSIYNASNRIWAWALQKMAARAREATAESPDRRLLRRSTKTLSKRGAPFLTGINVAYWVTRVVEWIYRRLDYIPIRIQQNVNEEYRAIQGAEWQVKQDEAEDKVKRIMAKEFPDFYRKTYIVPYEQGSELWDENEALLKEMQLPIERKTAKASGLQTRAIW